MGENLKALESRISVTLKTVLIAGDSISFGYAPLVAESLSGMFSVATLPENGGTSENLLARVDEWLIKPRFDIIQVNCGLHDLATGRSTLQNRAPIKRYRENVLRLMRILESSGSQVAWATTTPVLFWRHRKNKAFDRREMDVLLYNKAATGLAKKLQIPVNDLHDVVARAGREACISQDGVHMTDFGNRVLSEAVSRFIGRLAEGKTQ